MSDEQKIKRKRRSNLKTIENQARQGDVMLQPVDCIPADATEQPLDGKRIVLMHGEVTGHAHAFYDTSHVCLLETPRKERFLRVVETSLLRHEEHTEVKVPPGVYRLPTQSEWTDEDEPRAVED